MIPVWLPDTHTSALDRMVERALLWGLEGLELRTVGGPGERVPYVNEARLHARLTASELTVEAVVPGLFEASTSDRATWMNDLVLLDETVAFARRFRCGRIVVSAFSEGDPPDRIAEVFHRAGAVAARRDAGILVVNETDRGAATGEELAAILDGVGHPHVHAAWDPAVAAARGEAPSEGLAALEGRIGLVRYTPGVDGVDWGPVLARLASTGFAGPVSLVLGSEARAADGLAQANRMIAHIRDAASGQSRIPA